MNFEVYQKNNIILGYTAKTNSFLAFFGTRYSTLDILKNEFKKFAFFEMNQTHSDIVVPASDKPVESDAQYTYDPLKALLVKTADCLPVLIFDPNTGAVAAIHAGWRGVQKNIIKKTLSKINASDQSLLFIGPHITQDSFAVDLDVANLFPDSKKMYHPINEKYYINLEGTVKDQITEYGIQDTNIQSLYYNTFKNEDFYSYRREKQKGLRQYSFIVLL